MPVQSSKINAALRLHRMGFNTFPLNPETTGEAAKKPLFGTSWKKWQTEKVSEQQVIDWWTKNPNANIGIATGPVSDCVVVDLDNQAAEKFYNDRFIPAHMYDECFVTTAHGKHIYLTYPRGDVDTIEPKLKELHRLFVEWKKIDGAPKIDLQHQGRYVVGPGSVHPDGHTTYQWHEVSKDYWTEEGAPELSMALVDTLINELTPVIASLKGYSAPRASFAEPVAKPQLPTAPAPVKQQPVVLQKGDINLTGLDYDGREGEVGEEWVRRALDAETANVRSSVEGSRHNILVTAADKMGALVAAGVLDSGQARNALGNAALAAGLPDKEIRQVLRDGWKWGEEHPRNVWLRGQTHFVRDENGEVLQVVKGESSKKEDAVPQADVVAEIKKHLMTAADYQRRKRVLPACILSPKRRRGVGLLERLMTWEKLSSYCTQDIYCLPGALGILAGVCVHRICTNGNEVTTNLSQLVLGPSGSGKNTPKSSIPKAFRALAELDPEAKGLDLGQDIASAAALAAIVARPETRCGVLCIDEFGTYLKDIRDSKNSPKAGFFTMQVALSSAAYEPYTKHYSSKENMVDIPYNGLCFMGTTVAEPFYASLSTADAVTGYLPRLLVFESEDYIRKQWRDEDDMCSAQRIPPALVRDLYDIFQLGYHRPEEERVDNGKDGKGINISVADKKDGDPQQEPEITVDELKSYTVHVKLTPEAKKFEQRVLDAIEARREIAAKAGKKGEEALWNRALEQIKRVSLLFAASRLGAAGLSDPTRCYRNLGDVRRAAVVVGDCLTHLVDKLGHKITGSKYEKEVEEVFDAICKVTETKVAGGKAPGATERDILRIKSYPPKMLADVLKTLIQQSRILKLSSDEMRSQGYTVRGRSTDFYCPRKEEKKAKKA